MPSTFDEAYLRVKQLAADFKANEKFYLSSAYQETEARRDFIDKFLVAFGWDVNHDRQKNPYEQEVKVERKDHGVSQRRADYAFYLWPNFRDVKFYIEAKKPFGDIATTDNYFQTIRYGWNSQTPIAALFDFEQFEIVDCRFKPDLETALQRNLKKFHYSQFADKEKFAEIYWLFSHEAVAGGSLEKYAETLPKKRDAVQRGHFKGGFQSIDEAFLEELDAHRDTLAHIFKNSNPKLDGEALTEATQRTLDRLVFTRFLEDKLIEPQYLVARFGERCSAWGDFIATSRRLDDIYNGIVFKKNDILDSPTFKVNEDQFREICEALCHINSPYDFNAIPIHILGSIYERFLGKVIVATDKRAHVEEKPEVRKAGGVYYTPEYIVRYIVENTVGKLIEGKTPAQIAGMKFADIACGSGSFLLGVYDLLIRYHTKFYNENPGKAKKADVMKREDGLHLSLRKKREILVNNLYGVDIDNQAVEVAQLSLYLKLLQDETPGSTRQYILDFEQQALLPTLNKNIVCGNSLIGTDILSGELFEPVAERKLNPMDYEQRFPEIVKCGGFDAVIGNPPYIPIESMKEIERKYYQEHFPELERKYDTSVIFILAGLQRLNKNGRLGFISSITWQTGENFSELRKTLFEKYGVLTLVNLPFDVFADAYVDTGVYILSRSPVSKYSIYRFPKKIKITSLDSLVFREVKSSLVSKPDYKIVLEPAAQQILLGATNSELFKPLGELTESTQGLAASFFQTASRQRSGEWYPFASGAQAYRYEFFSGEKLYAYLGDHQSLKKFYEANPKILIRRVINRQDRLDAVYFDKQMVFKKDLNPFVLIDESLNPKFVLGILNSRLISYLYVNTSSIATKDDFRQTTLAELRRLPIRKLDLSKSAEKGRHDKMVSLVEQMLVAKPHLASAQSDKDKDFYENKCAMLDRQIDTLVYELYALTEAEIEIIEAP
jgi:adenine-specific DNA-methyltransferase